MVIGHYAFENCRALVAVEIPSTVTRIEQGAFIGCSSLTDIKIPSGIFEIEDKTFEGCSSLSNVIIPESVKLIGDGAFKNCTGLISVTIEGLPDVTRDYADEDSPAYGSFYGCYNLATINASEDWKREHWWCAKCLESYKPAPPPPTNNNRKSGCYIATAVYGSYDCPQVWTLRRYRDNRLTKHLLGRAFIRCYYAISPHLVKLFGEAKWFQSFWKRHLDKLVHRLKSEGLTDTPYCDKKW